MTENGTIRTRSSELYKHFEQLIAKFHGVYLGFVCLIALIGYAIVLLFPVLVVVGANNIYGNLSSDADIEWVQATIWFAVMLFSARVSYRMVKTRPRSVVGFSVSKSKIPEVYALIEKLRSHFKRPAIHKILITQDYELDIVKTPRWILPVWSSNTLIIGLPLLICLTPEQFEHMLARKIGQFSKRHNVLINWLYQLRGIWNQYSCTYAKQKYIESKVLHWIYRIYASFYEAISVYAARTDELNADSYAMELYVHNDICEMITADTLWSWYLKTRFWPTINKAVAIKRKSPLKPYQKLVTVIGSNLKAEKIDALKKQAFKQVPDWKDRMPSLPLRLENIGHDVPQMQEKADSTAAEYFLGRSLNSVLDLMDKVWLKNKRKRIST